MDSIGIYIHVPFCLSKCPYCAFISSTSIEGIPLFVSALIREIGLRSDRKLRCDTVHFGGGTPSLLPAREIERVMTVLRAAYTIEDGAEVAVEVNPSRADRDKLGALRRIGFNRLTLGVQSFDAEDLKFLGRIHDPDQTVQAVEDARQAGFDNVGLDLIYGLPGRDRTHWESQILRAVDLAPEHLSCYSLTIEEGTPMARRLDSGEFEEPVEEMDAELFLFTHSRLSELGYPAYEVSNFSREGRFPSRHNSKYWAMAPYLGFGPSAHSFEPPVRKWNVKSVEDYSERCMACDSPLDGSETLTPFQNALELLSLGLRTAKGVDVAELEARFDPNFTSRNEKIVDLLEREGLLVREGGFIKPTLDGLALSDGLALKFELEKMG